MQYTSSVTQKLVFGFCLFSCSAHFGSTLSLFAFSEVTSTVSFKGETQQCPVPPDSQSAVAILKPNWSNRWNDGYVIVHQCVENWPNKLWALMLAVDVSRNGGSGGAYWGLWVNNTCCILSHHKYLVLLRSHPDISSVCPFSSPSMPPPPPVKKESFPSTAPSGGQPLSFCPSCLKQLSDH